MNTSHVTQVATFEKLLGFCDAQGAMYNPTKDSLKVAALNSLLTSAQQSVVAANRALAEYGQAVFNRKETFGKLPKLMTRIIHALKATNASPASVAEAYRFKKRFVQIIRNRPAQPATTEAANGDPPPQAEKSRSQRAFNNQLSNFETLVQIVTAESAYTPNEPDLTATALQAFIGTLRDQNKAVLDAFVDLAAARKTRDKMLYSTGSVRQTAAAVKAYARSVFGTNSVVFREMSALKFVNQMQKDKEV